jgi:type VI secretion system secreted protein Hcp
MMASDYFLKIDGIEGESQDSKHPGAIELESFGWAMNQTGTFANGGGGGAGKVQMHDCHFVMKHGKASPKLMLACAEGEHFKKAVLTARKAGKDQREFLKVTLWNVLVSSFQTSGRGGHDEIPVDHISLNFAGIEHEYKEQKADGGLGGTIKAGYDLKKMMRI